MKQAFREVYVVTPAEEGARDHSQRFAGHIFRQARARALLKGRGWAARPLAEYDKGNGARVARRPFEHAGLRTEFAFDAVMTQRTGFGDLYPYCASRQVRFVPLASGAPVPLAEVPLLVFSEAMRDIDLVIGVSSIGALAEWLDQPDNERFGEDYWHQFGFGELGAAAGIRREVLASPGAEARDRRPLHLAGAFPRGAGRPPDLQDPPGQRQRPDVPQRPVPVHRRRARHPGGKGLPSLRRRPRPVADPQLGGTLKLIADFGDEQLKLA